MSTLQRAGPAVSKTGQKLPSRIILHGGEKIGKSSFAAHASKPIFAMTRGETGLLTLMDEHLVPETAHFEFGPKAKDIKTWADLKACVSAMTIDAEGYPFSTFVIDTLNGAERLCFDHLVQSKYGTYEKFNDYGKGPEVAQEEWINFLEDLDRLRAARRMSIILLCHTKVKTFKNPEGNDFDRYTPDMHEKIWGRTHKWADIILFANYETLANKEKGALKAKGAATGRRLLHTVRTAAWDAGNRHNLPEEIEMGNGGQEAWSNFVTAVKAAREANKPATVAQAS